QAGTGRGAAADHKSDRTERKEPAHTAVEHRARDGEEHQEGCAGDPPRVLDISDQVAPEPLAPLAVEPTERGEDAETWRGRGTKGGEVRRSELRDMVVGGRPGGQEE